MSWSLAASGFAPGMRVRYIGEPVYSAFVGRVWIVIASNLRLGGERAVEARLDGGDPDRAMTFYETDLRAESVVERLAGLA